MDFNFNAYKPKNILTPKRGRLLISEPLSQDSFFNRSIVFLTEYNKEGAFGFVLNKMSDYSLSELFDIELKFNPKVNYGGPVGTETVHFLHTLGDIIEGSRRLSSNLYWGGDFDRVKDLAKLGALNDKDIRFFIGYSGWAPMQLDDELKQNAWLVASSSMDIVFNTRTKEDWKSVLKQIDDKYNVWLNVPENPSFN